ncbi:hypothetical protein JXD20_00580 [Candidatus Peregrinibacteria bacterium]|nr:hypothetical protein [Candidatus Peregrinibacteria bacterium]
MPEKPIFNGPPPWERVRDYLGLQHRHPVGFRENLSYSLGIFSDIRKAVGTVMNVTDTEK